MTSKETIQNKINELNKTIKAAKELNYKALIEYCEEEIKKYNQVLKDLEDYEELKKITGTPIQEIEVSISDEPNCNYLGTMPRK